MLRLVLAAPLLLHAAPSPDIAPDIVDKFEAFKAKFSKTYASVEEEETRLAIFAENLGHILNLNVMDDSAEYSHLTPLADLSTQEFRELNNLEVSEKMLEDHARNAVSVQREAPLPDTFDWRKEGAVELFFWRRFCVEDLEDVIENEMSPAF